mmetsp:Transcript_38121/g.96398  ORF Transcript_38121/g.96398 Transcript_38121/m.96398 type:complete len:236 (-) Transcript_38121:892-1599(-)
MLVWLQPCRSYGFLASAQCLHYLCPAGVGSHTEMGPYTHPRTLPNHVLVSARQSSPPAPTTPRGGPYFTHQAVSGTCDHSSCAPGSIYQHLSTLLFSTCLSLPWSLSVACCSLHRHSSSSARIVQQVKQVVFIPRCCPTPRVVIQPQRRHHSLPVLAVAVCKLVRGHAAPRAARPRALVALKQRQLEVVRLRLERQQRGQQVQLLPAPARTPALQHVLRVLALAARPHVVISRVG